MNSKQFAAKLKRQNVLIPLRTIHNYVEGSTLKASNEPVISFKCITDVFKEVRKKHGTSFKKFYAQLQTTEVYYEGDIASPELVILGERLENDYEFKNRAESEWYLHVNMCKGMTTPQGKCKHGIKI